MQSFALVHFAKKTWIDIILVKPETDSCFPSRKDNRLSGSWTKKYRALAASFVWQQPFFPVDNSIHTISQGWTPLEGKVVNCAGDFWGASVTSTKPPWNTGQVMIISLLALYNKLACQSCCPFFIIAIHFTVTFKRKGGIFCFIYWLCIFFTGGEHFVV